MGSVHHANSSAVRKRIESHHFDDEEGEEYDASKFGGFGDYMRRKKLKLQNLDAEIRSSSPDRPAIFRGVVAHVNGYTQPSLQDLHRLIVSHGGGFLQYLDGKTAATHIIASSLTLKKREEFKRYRIVKPAWVVESVKAGRLLPWDLFRVVDEGHAQKIINFDNGRFLSQTNTQPSGYRDQTDSSWYTSRLKGVEAPGKTIESNEIQPDNIPTPVADDAPKVGTQSDYGEFPSFASSAQDVNRATTPVSRPTGSPEPSTPLNETNGAAGDGDSPKSPNVITPDRPSVRQSTTPKAEMTSEEYNAQLLADPRMRNSGVVNPEFIQQYYRESRLHHLSTWKAELKAQLQSTTKEKLQSQVGRKKPVPGARRYVLHVDFDCFFAAVSILKHPELKDQPVAIAHGAGSGSEIASCNYPARARGIKNGMWMKGALQACPELKVLPYDFPAYEEASQKFYGAVLSLDGVVQSVSIDEALVDITTQCLEAGGSDGRGISEGSIYREQARADEIAQHLRDSVKVATGCDVSVGIGGNILLAKVALRKAKPAGQFQLKPEAILDFIGNLTVQELPGVGYSLGAKLEELKVKFVKDIRDLSRERLITSLGPKTGAKLWDYSRGIDCTEVGNEVIRKSVSAEVNWGIRFVNQTQAEDFVRSLCEELHRRLVENLVKGKHLTLKVMRRAADAPLEPVKHLGHGKCDVFNKSVVLGIATNDQEILGKEAVSMLRSFAFSPGDLRGLGVQMTKLESLKSGLPNRPDGSQRQLDFKASPIRKSIEHVPDPDDLDSPRKGDAAAVSRGPPLNDHSHKPLNISGTQFIMPSQADPKVVAELPSDIRSKLMSQGKIQRASRSASPCPPARWTQQSTTTKLPPQSQLDPDTLAALPDDVRAEILGYYKQPSETPELQPAISPAPPPRPSSSSGNLKLKKPSTPTKKRRGRPSNKALGNMTLTQSNFVIARQQAAPSLNTESQPSSRQPSTDPDPEVSAEFLAALPEDIRQEVLEEQKRARLLQRTGMAPAAPRRVVPPKPSAPAATQEKRLRLSPLPERPTFTSKKLSSLSELRDELSAWHKAFADEGPFGEDVAALAEYLKRVVVDEKDLDKAVSLVSWLAWLAEDSKDLPGARQRGGASQGTMTWDETVSTLRESVSEGVDERGLPPVEFS
ncbi:putative DNA damage repair protein Mus42 [Aspergillus clavatus NRRL 1]|uniref:DNA repair protein REV1 n=1 Tax=Aspergillus clavatus (strain ATCC 1007 / CBS 513.65 / DSM 816 / NCTC 3887 / NRRL 1 / QM 1276 / 107) TaxID=344612 RepID=A1CTQ2_ASPCL|nr:DNA damage repair protein Mus42, putative [Aspergillus clavatus NRRL 1]EAW06689.1 DNA damage repair protein Mus42, putative [Aspergillus clavatus NRRL 1]